MISPRFIDYIRHQLAAGVAKEDIKKALGINGLSEQDITEGFATVQTTPPVPSVEAHAVAQPVATPATQAEVVSPQVISRPPSVRYFELLMYASIAASILTSVYQYGSQLAQIMSNAMLLVLTVPALILVGKFVLVRLAAHQRKNWARIVLLAPFLMNVLGIGGIIFFIIRDPIAGLLALGPIVLEVAAFSFAFSSSSNTWFAPQGSMTSAVPGQAVDNTIWRKGIPRTNIGFMVVSLLLVFGLDLLILISNPGLVGFWVEMLVVLGIFGIFFYLENYSFKRRFTNSYSTLDAWISAIIVIRNLTFVLNFIPLIQLLGAAGLVFGGIPFLILYSVLLYKRSKAV